MSVQDIVNLISTVGFPIVCCIAMGWYVKYTNDKQREEVKQLNEQHKSELENVTEALNNNTLAIQMLTSKLEKE